MKSTNFDPGIDIKPTSTPLGFVYGPGVFGPHAELRSLDSIRPSLLDADCTGPDPVYAIVMNFGMEKDRPLLGERNLLFGAVTYAPGRLGREAVRSQGHVHRKTRDGKPAPPEIYEIWSGEAVVYMQENADEDPGKCFAVEAGPGEVVIVPPGWAHAAVNAGTEKPMTFGALCDCNTAFDYENTRKRKGLAWYPVLDASGRIDWLPNPNYRRRELNLKKPGDYSHLGIRKDLSVYATFEEDPDIFKYVAYPELKIDAWEHFIP